MSAPLDAPVQEPLSAAALDQLFRTARTFNGYLDRPVTTQQLHALWDLMKFGPTSANTLPARIVWCISDEAKERLALLATNSNAVKIRSAPVTAIIAMDTEFHENLPWLFPHKPGMKDVFSDAAAREVMALRNSSLQAGYFILAARALGLGTGPMSGFDNAAVDAAFFAETPSVKSNLISTLGYGDPASVFERLPRPVFERFNRIA
jgi:3-hydroxypropanoate dehydrogenase